MRIHGGLAETVRFAMRRRVAGSLRVAGGVFGGIFDALITVLEVLGSPLPLVALALPVLCRATA